MKRNILIIYIILLIMTGCSLNNTPNSKTEELLNKYQKLDSSIIISPNVLANDNNLTIDLEKEYNKIIKKQYKNLSYEIKNTKEDGNTATITTEIKVLNYKKVIDNMNGKKGRKYHQRLINKLKETNERVTYTIDITLIKNEKGIWKVNSLSNEIEKKLLGIY